MIVDIMRLPTDDCGDMIHDLETIRHMFDRYQEVFPDHQVFAMPDNIKIWENLDLIILKSMRQFLDEIIISKEIEENGL